MDGRPISPEDDPTIDVEGHGMNLGNDNENVVSDESDVEGHATEANDDRTVVDDELDVEGHGGWANDNETVVSDESEPDVDDNEVVIQN
jgi:hypothetical protein